MSPVLVFFILFFSTITAKTIVPTYPVGNKTRTDFCPLLAKLKAGKVTIGTALTGLTVYVAVEPNSLSFNMNVNQTTGQPNGGFSYAVLQAIATAGGFKIKYIPVPNRPAGDNVTQWLLQVAPHVDLIADGAYAETPELRARGLDYTVGFSDMSAVLVTTVLTVPAILDVFNFRQPFSNELWILICMMVLFNSVFSWLLHIFDPDVDCTDRTAKLLDMFFKTIFTFANAQPSPPKTLPTRLVHIGFCVFLVISLATYTATLASVLFAPAVSQPTVTSITKPAGSLICAMAGSAMMRVVQVGLGDPHLPFTHAPQSPFIPRLSSSLPLTPHVVQVGL